MKTSIVTTTINIPKFLDAYTANFLDCKINPNDITFIIVGDTKTPEEAKTFVNNYSKEFPIEFWNVKDQEKWIDENYPNNKEDVAFAIPYQSVRRRNFGYLRALELGSGVIITIDDDNLPQGDWLGDHLKAFIQGSAMPTVFSPNKIINPCEMLSCNHTPVYMRGYPISEIYRDEFIESFSNDRTVVLNMGLWTNKPDVDSYTNIMFPDLISHGLALKERYACKPFHFIPINTQNTALLKEVMPAFYLLFQDTPIYEHKIDRFDDIWSGYILQQIAFCKGDTVSFGIPLTNHERNVHDLNKDLKIEFPGIALNRNMLDYIMSIDVNGTYLECYKQMIDGLENRIKGKYTEVIDIYFQRMFKAMKIWTNLVERWI